ncbi:hypothetical protein DEO72_LG11g1902 [Vigna unguiculata]|uniref:Uncharacterized protein n=1 Tax=Vigna unguiculata TaxID=3917 RepID=A0A4D6NMN0_VIGUN|nr:hypothetical protein DEO72_LG11g1902 [Vigna unguiculata]
MSWYVVWNCGCDYCRETVARNVCSHPSGSVSPRRDLKKQARSTLELSLKRELSFERGFSLRREGLAKARTREDFGSSLQFYCPGEGLCLWARGGLAQARRGSPKRESAFQ